jgi:hypothetical protein
MSEPAWSLPLNRAELIAHAAGLAEESEGWREQYLAGQAACEELTVERDALAAQLADWKRMRNEAMAVATSNRERINEMGAELAARDRTIAAFDLDVVPRLADRVKDLEAALRDLVDYTDITKHIDADAVTERVKRARAVLGLTAETKVDGPDTPERICPHGRKVGNGWHCTDCLGDAERTKL